MAKMEAFLITAEEDTERGDMLFVHLDIDLSYLFTSKTCVCIKSM